MFSRRPKVDQCIFCLYRSQRSGSSQHQVRRASMKWIPSFKSSRSPRRMVATLATGNISEKSDVTLFPQSQFIQDSVPTGTSRQRTLDTKTSQHKTSEKKPRTRYAGINTIKHRHGQREDSPIISDPRKTKRNEELDMVSTQHNLDRQQLFELVSSRFVTVGDIMKNSQTVRATGLDKSAFLTKWSKLEHQILSRLNNDTDSISSDLQRDFSALGKWGIDFRLRYLFLDTVYNGESESGRSNFTSQKDIADYRYPEERFAGARTLKRHIHLHVGPTNSGKTYQALKRLESAASGVYAGPLRLLAHEVYSRLNAKGIPCNLITGEERKVHTLGEAVKTSSTVEMVSLNSQMEVAVIDEIQMMGDQARGWAWTEAFMGVRAAEVHLCGEERVVPLVKELAAVMGEPVTVHRYERLSPLRVLDSSLDGNFSSLQKGDCIICFSRRDIHMLKAKIERISRKKCAIVYGGLPPESRAQQAKLFNDPDNEYDILVASDAVGMGLNLAIKRVIFYKINKPNGFEKLPLKVTEVKQIAGRAGRYRTADQATKSTLNSSTEPQTPVEAVLPPAENVGLVTVFEPDDLDFVKRSMVANVTPLRTAGLIASNEMITKFSARFPPEVPLSYILVRLQELMKLPRNGKFHMCSLRSQVLVADSIQHIKGLSLADRLEFIAAPADCRDDVVFEKMLIACAELVAGEREGDLLEMEEYNLEVLEEELKPDDTMLPRLEHLHKGLVLYLWLSFRFQTYFKCRALANHAKQLVEKKIEDQLALLSASRSLIRKYQARDLDGNFERPQKTKPKTARIRTVSSERRTWPTVRKVKSKSGRMEPNALHKHLLTLLT